MPSAIDAIKEGRASVYKVRRKHCKVRTAADTGSNPRIDFGEIPVLAAQIAAHGILTPLTGTMAGKHFMVGHGERRLAAFDYAVEHLGLNPKSEKGLIPVQPEALDAKTADRDRLILHVVLNESKPLNQFEKGTAMKRLIEQHGLDEKQVAEELGCSGTHVADCLRLVNGSAPEVQLAVASGKLSSTAAIDLVKEVPDPTAQASVLEQGQQNADAAGSSRITAKHLPLETGKRAQASRKRGSTPFDGKDSTPDTATSNAKGEFTQGCESVAIPFQHKKVQASVLTAKSGSTYYVGWRITWPGTAKGDGFKLVHPSLEGLKSDTPENAFLLGITQIRAELELKKFKDKEVALADIDVRIAQLAAAVPEAPKASKPAGSAPSNPVIKEKSPTEELKETIDALDPKMAEKDRLTTAKKIYSFLKGKMDSKDLAKFILGI